MGAIKNYFKHQFQTRMFSLEYENVSDFYISSFQKNKTILPLFFVRGVLFFGCVAIVISSFTLTAMYTSAAFWPIYMTHWGLILITLATGFAFGVSAQAYYKGPIDATFGLPWYVKAYWISYSIAIPIALFITVFYWIFLSGANEDFAVSAVLDIFIHAINSVLMIILLVTARHPTNLLHFYIPIFFAIIYAIFSVIYYFAGGTDPFGNNFIYPVLDWAQPGVSFLMIGLSTVMIIIIHLLIALITVGRDAFVKSYLEEPNTFNLYE